MLKRENSKYIYSFLFLTALFTPVVTANAEGDWEGPKFLSVNISPSTLDVSNNSAYADLAVRISDASGVKSATLQFRNNEGGIGIGPDISLSKCLDSKTDCVLNGKIIISKKYRPGKYILVNLMMIDELGNRSNISLNTISFNILNTAGNLDPNEVLTLPSGISMEDYLSDRYIQIYQNSIKTLNATKQTVSSTLAGASSLNLELPQIPNPPSNQVSLSGDEGLDMSSIMVFSVKVQQYKDATISILNRLQSQISEARIKNIQRTIICKNGKILKKVTGVNPKCPKGYKVS